MLEKDPRYRIRAEDALKDSYFTEFKIRKRVPSTGSGLDVNKIITQEDVRNKVSSTFTRPEKIPYLSKDDDVHNMIVED